MLLVCAFIGGSVMLIFKGIRYLFTLPGKALDRLKRKIDAKINEKIDRINVVHKGDINIQQNAHFQDGKWAKRTMRFGDYGDNSKSKQN